MTTTILLSIIACMSAFIGWLMHRHIELIDRNNRKKIKREIKQAVKSENYELAAILRDKIKKV